jgi:nicotinate-nucleotide adenylyltransferase
MRIGILGGSFDPPHLGHILIAHQTKEIMHLDEVWLVPYFAHSWKKTHASASHRLKMTKLLEEPGIKICDVEIKHEGKNYTVDTVETLKKKYSHEFFWIVGSDTLEDFHKWKSYERLIQEINFIVFPRYDYPQPKSLPPEFHMLLGKSLILSTISSSMIRERVRKNLPVDHLVCNPVLSYIQKHKLYS